MVKIKTINNYQVYQPITGSGFPSALQFNVTGSFFGTTISLGCSVIRGVRYCAERKKKTPQKEICWIKNGIKIVSYLMIMISLIIFFFKKNKKKMQKKNIMNEHWTNKNEKCHSWIILMTSSVHTHSLTLTTKLKKKSQTEMKLQIVQFFFICCSSVSQNNRKKTKKKY